MSDQEVNPIARSLMKSKSPRPPGKGGNVRRRVPIYKRGWFGALVVVTLIIGVTAFGMIMAILAPLQEQAESLDITDLQKIEVASRIMDARGRNWARSTCKTARPSRWMTCRCTSSRPSPPRKTPGSSSTVVWM
ncbi:hypothetical protein [Verrucomicrobium spinosum]|uniref:hypothetical protein n=1 Tax=Verrucomicrobium spinosum TaxID=2736 RepID=UPI000AB9AC76|nr:hypothetical protein [Verrucomicrobium spinosum]